MDDRFEQARAAFLAGVQQHEAGRLADAEQSFLQAQALVPGRASVAINLAATRLALGKPGPVPDDLAPLLAAEPEHPEALALLARALTALDQPARALPVLERLLQQRPADAELQHRRGLLLGRLDRADEALAAFEQALALDATHAAAWTQRGSLLREAGRLAEARHCFEQALAHGGEPTLNRWFLAAVTGESAAGQAPAAYVQALFDGYADGFDAHLLQGLGYSAHQGVVDLLPPGHVYAHALDLGCGTGLCAPPLQGRVQRLTGVDLSPRMLAQARARGLYRVLHEAEAVQWLQQTPERFDLALAADVFIYIGDLAPVFAGLSRVLQPGAHLVFSVEQADHPEAVQLGAQLRYRHGEAALRRLAAAAGFTVEAVLPTVLRHEQQRPISGLLFRLLMP